MNDHAAPSGTPPLDERESAILVREITAERMEECVRRYSDPKVLKSRHVGHVGNIKAVELLTEELRRIGGSGFSFHGQRSESRKGPSVPWPNVEARLPGVNSDEVVIVAAHLDCTAERDPSYRPAKDPAPGADDDASGIAGVLAAAHAIIALADAHPAGMRRAEIRFILFNAEEIGQRGSREYAKREAKLGTSISAVYTMDMIGYQHEDDSEFEVHAGFKKNPVVQVASLEIANHLAEVCAAVKVPLMPQIYYQRPKERDPGQGFSDHTSFHRHCYPAIMISQNFFHGQVTGMPPAHPNPDYHMPEDTADNLNFDYAANIARAVTAAAWHWATRPRWPQRHATAAVHEHESQEPHEHDAPESHEHGNGH